jgi:hypothetical protein
MSVPLKDEFDLALADSDSPGEEVSPAASECDEGEKSIERVESTRINGGKLDSPAAVTVNLIALASGV